MIGIIDYGMGNLESVRKAFAKVGHTARRIRAASEVASCDRIVLPGVGAFGQAMTNLARSGFIPPLRRAVDDGRPLLGICLGLQLLFSTSSEHGRHEGLGWLPGHVDRLPDSVRVPHVGWNEVRQTRPSRLFDGIPDRAHFYFVQSYYVDAARTPATMATTAYGPSIVAAVEDRNLFAVQFHPEKSQEAGLRLLDNFGRLACS